MQFEGGDICQAHHAAVGGWPHPQGVPAFGTVYHPAHFPFSGLAAAVQHGVAVALKPK